MAKSICTECGNLGNGKKGPEGLIPSVCGKCYPQWIKNIREV